MAVIKPRYVRVNTNILSRADAMEIFQSEGWQEVSLGTESVTYDKFLETVRNLGKSDYVSDIHVNNLFVFPTNSAHYWARHELVEQSKLILQDKVSEREMYFYLFDLLMFIFFFFLGQLLTRIFT